MTATPFPGGGAEHVAYGAAGTDMRRIWRKGGVETESAIASRKRQFEKAKKRRKRKSRAGGTHPIKRGLEVVDDEAAGSHAMARSSARNPCQKRVECSGWAARSLPLFSPSRERMHDRITQSGR